jgi:hypothetical protein
VGSGTRPSGPSEPVIKVRREINSVDGIWLRTRIPLHRDWPVCLVGVHAVLFLAALSVELSPATRGFFLKSGPGVGVTRRALRHAKQGQSPGSRFTSCLPNAASRFRFRRIRPRDDLCTAHSCGLLDLWDNLNVCNFDTEEEKENIGDSSASISVAEILQSTADAFPAASQFPIGESLTQAILSPLEAADLLYYLMSVMLTVSTAIATEAIRTTSITIGKDWMPDMEPAQRKSLKSAIETATSKGRQRRNGRSGSTKRNSKS